MTLTLITGLSAESLRTVAVEMLVGAVREGRDAVWALPDTATARRESRSLARVAPVGVQSTTLDRLLSSLWALYGDGRGPVGAVNRAAIVAECLERHAGKLLSPVAQSDRLRNTIASLAMRTFDPSDLLCSTPLEAEVAEVLGDYFATLHESGMVEPSQMASELPGLMTYRATVVVSSFPSLSSSQMAFVRGLSRTADVVVLLNWEENFPATASLTPVVLELEDGCDRRIRLAHPPSEGEIALLAERLSQPGGVIKPTGCVMFAGAVGEEAEPVLVSRIVREAIERGTRPREIAITGLALNRSLVSMQEALSAQGIPVDVDVAIPMEQTPLGKAFLSLFSIVVGSGGRAEALAFLHSPYVCVDSEKTRKADLDWRADRRTTSRDILNTFKKLGEGPRGIVMAALDAQSLPIGREWAGKWEGIVSKMLAAGIRHGQREGFAAQLDAAVQSSIVKAIGQAVDAGPTLSQSGFLEAVAEMAVPTGSREAADAVQMVETRRLRTRTYPMVVLTGMSASDSDVGADESLISRLAKGMGLDPGPDPALERNMLFYAVVSNTGEKLVLTRTVEGLDGARLRSSVYWDEAASAYGWDGGFSPDSSLPEGLPTQTLSLARIEDAAPSFDADRVELRRAVFSGQFHLPRTPRGVLSDRIAEEFSLRDEFSVTEIERYLGCPYRWFFDRVVAAEDVDAEFGAREKGKFAHSVLERFNNRVMEELPAARVTSDDLERALSMLREVIADVQKEGAYAPQNAEETLVIQALVRKLEQTVAMDALLPSELKPAYLEWIFKGESAFELNGVRLRGRIDRIDESRTGVAVFDYKTGDVKKGINSLVTSDLIQLPIYGMAASQMLGKPLVLAAYRPVGTGRSRGLEIRDALGETPFLPKDDLLSEDDLEDILAAFGEKVLSAATGIRQGIIAPKPSSDCKYCSARLFCDVGKA